MEDSLSVWVQVTQGVLSAVWMTSHHQQQGPSEARMLSCENFLSVWKLKREEREIKTIKITTSFISTALISLEDWLLWRLKLIRPRKWDKQYVESWHALCFLENFIEIWKSAYIICVQINRFPKTDFTCEAGIKYSTSSLSAPFQFLSCQE